MLTANCKSEERRTDCWPHTLRTVQEDTEGEQLCEVIERKQGMVLCMYHFIAKRWLNSFSTSLSEDLTKHAEFNKCCP